MAKVTEKTLSRKLKQFCHIVQKILWLAEDAIKYQKEMIAISEKLKEAASETYDTEKQ